MSSFITSLKQVSKEITLASGLQFKELLKKSPKRIQLLKGFELMPPIESSRWERGLVAQLVVQSSEYWGGMGSKLLRPGFFQASFVYFLQMQSTWVNYLFA